jgi:cell division protein FtsB
MGARSFGLTGRQRRAAALAVLAAVLASVLLGNKGFRRLVINTFRLKGLATELAELKAEEAGLQRKIDAAATDDRALERAARRELGYLKPGEVEYRFPPPVRTEK